MKTALRVNSDLSTEVIDLTENEYTQLSTAVGGYIQAVSISPNITLWCNEEGKMFGLPVNIPATVLWESSFGRTDVIVGDVVFTGGVDDEGETVSLSDFALAKLQRTVSELLA